MKNAQTELQGFLQEGEQIVVDSFSYLSNKTKTTWVAYLTNQRFILKQANVSLTGMGIQDGLGEADIAVIPLNQLRGIKLKKGRLVINGDIYSEGHSSSDFGTFGKGIMGGLSYSSGEEVYVRLLNALSEFGEEYGFYLWTPENPEKTTANDTQQKRLTKIVNSEFMAALAVCGVLVVGFAGLIGVVSLFEGEQQPQYSSIQYVD